MAQATPKIIRGLLQPDKNSTNLILTTFPTPVPNFEAGEHLIKVYAVAPCNGELLWTRDFSPPGGFPDKHALIPCYDLAGLVIESPPSSPFKPGDRVYGRTNFYREGNAREYTIGLTEELAIIPKNLSWTDAASVALSALTAWQALFVESGLGGFESGGLSGKRVLVAAASSAAGLWTVQLAKLAGAEVIGVCGAHNMEYVKSLGASEVLDYQSVDFQTWAQREGNKADVVIHCIGEKLLEDSWWCVKDGGVLISIYRPPEEFKPAVVSADSIRHHMFIMNADGPLLETISRLLEDEKLRTVVDSVYSLDEFEKVFAKLEGRKVRGKIVINITK